MNGPQRMAPRGQTAGGSPISMGPKGTRLDWSAFEERAMRVLGRLPVRSVPMPPADLRAIGFVIAADALSPKKAA